jgi:hypothetical protein
MFPHNVCSLSLLPCLWTSQIRKSLSKHYGRFRKAELFQIIRLLNHKIWTTLLMACLARKKTNLHQLRARRKDEGGANKIDRTVVLF